MHPLLLLPLGIISPLLLTAALLVPTYAGIAAAVWIIYDKGGPHPLNGKFDDVFYIIDTYGKLFSHWLQHITEVSVIHYTIPFIGLPLFGIGIALWLTTNLVRKLKNIFQHER